VVRAELDERVAEAVSGVALGVVAHDRLNGTAALLEHPRSGPSERGRHGDRVLGRVDLAVRQASVIVDHADDLDLPGLASLVLLAALTGRPVTGPIEAGKLERVDVQQRAGLGPFVALGGLRALGAPSPRDAVACENLVDRRAMAACEELQLQRAVVRLRPGDQDCLLRLDRQRPPERGTPFDQQHQLMTAQQSELAPTVFHVRSPSVMQSW